MNISRHRHLDIEKVIFEANASEQTKSTNHVSNLAGCCSKVKTVKLASKPAVVGCERIVVDEVATSANFKRVQRQILSLQGLNISDCQQRQQHDKEASKDESRLATIFSIYLKILRMGPLEVSHSGYLDRVSTGRDVYGLMRLEKCRVGIVDYIEHLSGYSQTMNQLRLILKSPTMISVIDAYETLTDKLDTIYSTNKSFVAGEG